MLLHTLADNVWKGKSYVREHDQKPLIVFERLILGVNCETSGAISSEIDQCDSGTVTSNSLRL